MKTISAATLAKQTKRRHRNGADSLREAISASTLGIIDRDPEPTGEALVFYMPLPSNLGNSRLHWSVRTKVRTHYGNCVADLVALKRLPPMPANRFPRVKIKATVTVAQQMDLDNLWARLKLPLDALKRGWILDDNPDCLEWESMPEQIVICGHPGQVIFYVSPEEI